MSKLLISVLFGATLCPGAYAQCGSANGAAPNTAALISAPCSTRIAQDWHPMTRTERASRYVQKLIGANAIFFTFARVGINQGLDRPEGWKQDGEGFGYRLASSYGQHAINVSFEDGIALGLGEDNRYFASGEQGFGRRLTYAIGSSFLARHDNGTRSVSVSAIVGPASGSFISRLWMPDGDNSVSNGFASWAITEGIRVGFNVGREFAPRLVRRFLK